MLWLEAKDYRAPITFIGQSSAHVHLARIAVGGVTRECYVKLYHPGSGCLGSEVLGHILARELGVPAPRVFGVIPLSAENMKGVKPPHWLIQADGPQQAFFCNALPGETMFKLDPDNLEDSRLWQDVLDSAGAKRIAALDHWTGNRDRHGGNLLRLPTGAWATIDYGLCLGNVLWPKLGPLHARETHLLKVADQMLRGIHLRNFRASVIAAAEEHEAAWRRCELDAASHLSKLHSIESVAPVLAFLGSRHGRQWMALQLGELG